MRVPVNGYTRHRSGTHTAAASVVHGVLHWRRWLLHEAATPTSNHRCCWWRRLRLLVLLQQHLQKLGVHHHVAIVARVAWRTSTHVCCSEGGAGVSGGGGARHASRATYTAAKDCVAGREATIGRRRGNVPLLHLLRMVRRRSALAIVAAGVLQRCCCVVASLLEKATVVPLRRGRCIAQRTTASCGADVLLQARLCGDRQW